jgi:hypothetical protein
MMDTEPFGADMTVRKADEETWARVREEYAKGLTPRFLAERHGLGERNIRRRAAREAWSRGGGGPDLTGASAALEAFDEARKVEVNELLLHPSRTTLSKFAFRRATEAAAFGRPGEAANWLRLVDQLRRNERAVDSAERTFEPADVIRANYASAILFAEELDGHEDEAQA